MGTKEWFRAEGAEGLEGICHSMKVSAKRTVYNKIRALKLQTTNVEPAQGGMQRELAASRFLDIECGIEDIRSQIVQLKLLEDKDVVEQAAKVFQSITILDGFVEGALGNFNMQFRSAVYNIGKLRIRYQLSWGERSSSERRISVENSHRPPPITRDGRSSAYPHPHVDGSGYVCWGTWKGLMAGLAENKANWLRILVMTAEFLKTYSPSGPPYIKLALGWSARHRAGPVLCKVCEQPPGTCSCVQTNTAFRCPVTSEPIPALPFLRYCSGCVHYLPQRAVPYRQAECMWGRNQADPDPVPTRTEGENGSDPSPTPPHTSGDSTSGDSETSTEEANR
jgi:hypothetical protein